LSFELCKLGKHVQSFPKITETKCNSIFSIIHFNIWGPSQVTSLGFYALDILKETSMIDSKPVDCPIDPNKKLMAEQGEVLSNTKRFRRLVRKLIYLTITKPNLSFVVGVVN